jgi:hypothetical protein
MSRKRANVGARVRALVFFVVLSAMTLTVVPAFAALPEGRVYEQVSPEFKAGYPVFGLLTGFALDGESFSFSSLGAFNGSGEDFGLNPYVARRTAGGWVTSGLFPPANGIECAKGLEERSPDLSRFEDVVATGATGRACEISATNTVWVRTHAGEPGESVTRVSPVLTTASGEENAFAVAGGRRDLSRVVIGVSADTPKVHFVPSPAECAEGFVDEKQGGKELFEAEGCALRRVGVDNTGEQISLYCNVELGGGRGGFGAISQPAASEVFFSVGINSRTPVAGGAFGGCPDKTATPIQLFVRVNGERTLTVSASLAGDCTEDPCKTAAEAMPKDAEFQGASEDGSRVFFTTTQPLVNADKDTGSDLYMASIGCAGAEGEACGSAPREVTSLVQVSHDPHAGQAADVGPRVAAISPDGSHVYFVASGDLLGEAEREALAGEGRPLPQEGAQNLYVYERDERYPAGHIAFIADLCSGPELSGSVSDSRCPGNLGANAPADSGLWAFGGNDEAQTTKDGRFLVFSTYGQMISSGLERDADTARDVYRYDAHTGSLRRVSIGEAGFDQNGNNSAFDATIPPSVFNGSLQEQYELGSRAVSEDGSTIVFTTSEPLSGAATNGQADVYVWHEGSVGLISSGSATEADQLVGITPSGRDVFFKTSAGLVTGDTDGLADIYDARVGGGFPPPPAAREPCSGDACQGPLSAPAPLLVGASLSQQAGGNVAAPVVKAKPKRKAHKKRKAKHKRGRRARKSTHAVLRGRRGR